MLRYRKHSKATRGGIDLVLSLTADQHAALGGDAAELADQIDTALVAIAAQRTGLSPVVPADSGISLKDNAVGHDWQEWVISDLSALITRLEGVRDAAIRTHESAGGTFGELATSLGVPRSTAQEKRTAIVHHEPKAPELWATGEYAPVDHFGSRVPSNMRDWDVPWSGYLPVDTTPPELRPDGLAEAVAEGWAEPYEKPTDVPSWSARLNQANILFGFDDRGWPLNPTGRTGRTGRNLGKWGENQAADPIVVAGKGADRRVLLIRRSDIDVWALPGGMVDPGELASRTAIREAAEETGVDLTQHQGTRLGTTYVVDWRETDHAWITSTYVLYELDAEVEATAADDATEVGWFPFPDGDTLSEELDAVGGLYEAHRPMLDAATHYLA